MNKSTILDSIGYRGVVYTYLVGVGLIFSGVGVLLLTR